MALPSDDHMISLLARSALRDRAAFSELYESTSANLFGIVLRITRQREAAEEVMQEAWVQIWEKAQLYRPDHGRPFTWMAAIARYRALDRLRRQSRQAAMPSYDEPTEELMGEVDMESALTAHAEGGRLQACLGQLSGEAREAIVLSYVAGYSHGELAERMDHPLGTIKSWIRRGLGSLKECMQQ